MRGQPSADWNFLVLADSRRPVCAPESLQLVWHELPDSLGSRPAITTRSGERVTALGQRRREWPAAPAAAHRSGGRARGRK